MEALPVFMALLSFLADTPLTDHPLAINTPLQQQQQQPDGDSGGGCVGGRQAGLGQQQTCRC